MTGASPHWLGWRFWLAGPCEVDGVTRPVLASPIDTRAYHGHVYPEQELWLTASPRTAICRATTHTAPAPACQCGYRIVRRLADVVRYARDYGSAHTGPPSANPGEPAFVRMLRRLNDRRVAPYATWVAFGAVEGTGRAFGGVDDAPDTVRVERIRLVGPLLLSPTIADYAREFERYYPVTAYPGRGDYQQWLDGISISRRPKIADPDDWPDATTTGC